MNWPRSEGEFRLGDLPVQSGEIIRDAKLVWKTHGTLAPGRDNVVLYPCSYGAKHEDLEWLIGPDGILDPIRWFIVIPNMMRSSAALAASPKANAPPTHPSESRQTCAGFIVIPTLPLKTKVRDQSE